MEGKEEVASRRKKEAAKNLAERNECSKQQVQKVLRC